jgi:CO/xanthine dehydrogenase FAD-binding subunit
VKLPPFTLHHPGSVGQASRLLAALAPRGDVARARLIVGSVGRVPFAAGVDGLLGAVAADFARRADACAGRAAAGCAPSPDGECSADYLRHLLDVHARRALGEAFAAAAAA